MWTTRQLGLLGDLVQTNETKRDLQIGYLRDSNELFLTEKYFRF